MFSPFDDSTIIKRTDRNFKFMRDSRAKVVYAKLFTNVAKRIWNILFFMKLLTSLEFFAVPLKMFCTSYHSKLKEKSLSKYESGFTLQIFLLGVIGKLQMPKLGIIKPTIRMRIAINASTYENFITTLNIIYLSSFVSTLVSNRRIIFTNNILFIIHLLHSMQ